MSFLFRDPRRSNHVHNRPCRSANPSTGSSRTMAAAPESAIGVTSRSRSHHRRGPSARFLGVPGQPVNAHQAKSSGRAAPSRDDSVTTRSGSNPVRTLRPSGGPRRAAPGHDSRRCFGKRIISICGGSETSRSAADFQAEILRRLHGRTAACLESSTTRSWPARSRWTRAAKPC